MEIVNECGANAMDFKLIEQDPAFYVKAYYNDFPSKPHFYIYGAGNVGRKMLRALRKKGHKVVGFIDNNLRLVGSIIDGIPVVRASILTLNEEAVCVLSIWRYQHDPRTSFKHAQHLGFKNVIHFSALTILYDMEDVFPNYAIDHPRSIFTGNVMNRWSDLKRHFKDPSSISLAKSVLEFHALPILDNLPRLNVRPLPFDATLIRAYIDCGAFNGDHFLSELPIFSGLNRAYLIEPDPQNWNKLTKRELGETIEIDYINAAIDCNEGLSEFAANGNWGSCIAITENFMSTISVRTLTLDHFLNLSSELTYVKIDIEGNELRSLKGAIQMLGSKNVVFSITLEHKSCDIFEIPEFLESYKHRRSFLYAMDTEFCMDLVLYSVPQALCIA